MIGSSFSPGENAGSGAAGSYVATFYSHFGAMAFKKKCDQAQFPARIMPVPRALSSSCGTCVRFCGDYESAAAWQADELEQIACQTPDGSWQTLWENLSDA